MHIFPAQEDQRIIFAVFDDAVVVRPAIRLNLVDVPSLLVSISQGHLQVKGHAGIAYAAGCFGNRVLGLCVAGRVVQLLGAVRRAEGDVHVVLDRHIDRNQGVRVVIVELEYCLTGVRVFAHSGTFRPRIEHHIVLPGRLGIAFRILPSGTPTPQLLAGDNVDELAVQHIFVFLQLADLRHGFHRLEDVAFLQVAGDRVALVIHIGVVGMRPGHLHREGTRQLLVVVHAGGGGHEPGRHGVAVAEVLVIAHRAGVQRLVHLGFVIPLPVADHGVALGVLHGHAGDHVAGGHVLLGVAGALFIALCLRDQLLTVGQLRHAEVRAPGGGQRRLVDGEGQRPGGGFLAAVAPHAGIGILQRQGDAVDARVGLGFVARHGVVSRFGNVQTMGLAVVGHGGGGVGHRHGLLAHVDGHVNGGGHIVRGVGRGEDQRVLVRADRVQLGGGIRPGEAAIQGVIGIIRILGRLLGQRNIAQVAADRGGVIDKVEDGRGGADNRDRCSGLRAFLLHGVQILVEVQRLVVEGELIAGRNPDLPVLTGLPAVHGECTGKDKVPDVILAEPHAGIHIHHVVAEQVLANKLRDIVFQRACRVLNRLGQLHLQLHADLGIHGDERLGGAVGGREGRVRREHHLVHLGAVVRAQGHDGAVRPGEGAGHLVALFVDGLAGQRHLGQRRAVGDVLAAHRIGVVHLRRDGHGGLQHRQGDFLAVGGCHAAVIGVGDGHLHGVSVAGAVLDGLANLLRRHGQLRSVIGAVLIIRQDDLGHGHNVLHAVEAAQVHLVFIRDGFQRQGHNAVNFIRGQPGSLVFAVAHGAHGNRHGEGLALQPGARPAGEFVAVGGGVVQHNVRVLDGVGGGVGRSGLAADERVVNGVHDGRPLGGQGDVAHGGRRDVHVALAVRLQRVNAGDHPAREVIARTGGRGQEEPVALDAVGGGVVSSVLTAVQLVVDGIRHRLPARVQHHRALNDVGFIQLHTVALAALGGTVPAGEFVMLTLRILRDDLQRHARVFQVDGVGIHLLAVVRLIGQDGDAAPAGVEGHALGQHIRCGIHRFAGELGVVVPAQELIAVVVGQGVFQRGVAHPVRGIGVAGVFGFIAGEDGGGFRDGHDVAVDFLRVAVGDVLCQTHRANEVHGDVHAPVGVKGDVAVHLLREVEGLALAGGVVVPPGEGQTADVGIGRLTDRLALVHIVDEVGAQRAVVVQEVHLVAAYALQVDLHVAVRHGEADPVAPGGILQPPGIGGDGHIPVAVLHLRVKGDGVAGGDGGHLCRGVGGNGPGINALAVGDGELVGHLAQGQHNLGLVLAAVDHQAAVHGDAVHLHHDGAVGAVEQAAAGGQAPAALLALHGLEGHRLSVVAAADREHGTGGHLGRVDDVGDFAGIALVAAGEQVEGQVVFHGGAEHVVAHGLAPGRHVAQVADAGDAVLHGTADVIQRGIEPGQAGRIDVGVLLPYLGQHGVQVDFTGCGGFHGAAQHMGVLEGGRIQGGVVPVRRLDAPGMGTPVVQCDAHVHGGDGNLELTIEGEGLAVILDQLGLVAVLIGQHHVALVAFHLVGGSGVFIRIHHAKVAVHTVADVEGGDAGIIRRHSLAVDDDVLQRQLRGNVALLQVFEQQLVLHAAAVDHVVGLHGQVGQGIAGLVVGVEHGGFPQFIQLAALHNAHGHAAPQGVQRPAVAPQRPGLLHRHDGDFHLKAQLDLNIDADLQVNRAEVVPSACRQGIGVHEHACQFHVGEDRACDGYGHDMAHADGQGDADAHPHADLADQVDLGGHLAGQLLLVGAALELLEVVVEADLVAVLRHDLHAEGRQHAELAHQLHIDAQGDDAVEGMLVLEQGHREQILILQLRVDQVLHGGHQRFGRRFIIHVVQLGTIRIDNGLQGVLRLVQHADLAAAGGRRQLQPDGGLGLEQHGHVQPQDAAVHVDVHGQLFLEVQVGGQLHQQTLGPVQGHRDAHADARDDGVVPGVQLNVQLGIGHMGNQRGQGVGTLAVHVVQPALGLLAGHHSHQHLGLQLVIGGQLAGNGPFDLPQLLRAQLILQVHFLGGVHIQVGDVILGIRIAEGHLAGAVLQGLHAQDLRKQHIARQVAALPGIDRRFVTVDLAVVEHDDLLRLEGHLAGHDQRAGDNIALGVMILQHVVDGAVLGIIGGVLNVRLVHGGIVGHAVPQHVGQAIVEFDDLHLLAVDAHRQGIDIFRVAGELHAVCCIQGKGGAGGEARLAVKLRAALGFTHGDFGSLQGGTGFHGNAVLRLGGGHALGQHQADGRSAVGQLDGSDGAGILLHLLLIGGVQGVEGHALLDGIGIAEARGAFLVRAPAHEGIALLGGVQALHRLGQQIFAPGKHHGLQLAAAEGLKGDGHRLGFIHEAGVQGHLPVHHAQAGHGLGIGRILVPGGEDLPLQLGGRLAVIHRAAGGDFLGLHRSALGHEGHQPLAQHKVNLLAGLQGDHLRVGAGHVKGGVRLVDDGAGGPHGQGAHGLLHANNAQRAAALDDHLVSAPDDHLGQLRAGIQMQIDQIGRIILLHRRVMNVHAADFALAQINAAPGIQGERLGLHGGQGQLLRRRNGQPPRQHRGHGQPVAHDGDVARIFLALQAVNGLLGIHHGREGRFHQLHILVARDGRGRVNLRRLLGQIAVLRQDGQINAVILQAEIGNPLRMGGQVNVRRILDDVAQHPGNLLAGLRPGDLAVQGQHVAGRLPPAVRALSKARQAAGGEDGHHHDHRKEPFHVRLHLPYPPAVKFPLAVVCCLLESFPPAKRGCAASRGSTRR